VLQLFPLTLAGGLVVGVVFGMRQHVAALGIRVIGIVVDLPGSS
jgi:hypothetical protein